MKKVYFRLKYNWHVSKFKKIKQELKLCMDQSRVKKLDNEAHYHERAAFNYMFKS